jgi:hypothetical protein
MSHLFFDHLVDLKEVEKKIKTVAQTPEEKEELWQIVDELVHHQVLGCIFDHLPQEHHEEFLELFHAKPFDGNLLEFLKNKIKDDIETLIRTEIQNLQTEILEEIRN